MSFLCISVCYICLIDHPLAGAFRALNEEGKSNKELAEMYKDEGNEWLKGTKTMAHSEQLKKGRFLFVGSFQVCIRSLALMAVDKFSFHDFHAIVSRAHTLHTCILQQGLKGLRSRKG